MRRTAIQAYFVDERDRLENEWIERTIDEIKVKEGIVPMTVAFWFGALLGVFAGFLAGMTWR